jgi:shikimate kinase
MTKPETLAAAGRVYLVGLRGCGKTTVAKILARQLGWSFADADDEIEATAGCSIAEILRTFGMAGLRDREADVLKKVAQFERHVIATAGGCVIREANRALMRATGVSIWLTAEPETLWQRMQQDPSTISRRPRLTDLDPRAEIDRLAAEREPWYREVADLAVSTDNQSPEQVAATILRTWPSS